MPIDALPAFIHERLQETFTNFSIHQVEKVNREGSTTYEVELFSEYHRKWFELTFAENGKLLEREEL